MGAINKDLGSFEEKIGYKYKDQAILKNALSHSSYVNEVRIKNLSHNERLEYLGDAVLELVSSEYIYKTYPDYSEGKMSKLRASIVCEPTLALCAKAFDLADYIYLGKGEEHTGGRKRDSIVSDACEAVIGSIFLDGGFEAAKTFIHSFILNDLENKTLFYDSKTILQEMVQAQNKEISYEFVSEEGPDHDKTFTMRAYVEDMFDVTAKGHTKKAAEQQAAYQAILELRKK